MSKILQFPKKVNSHKLTDVLKFGNEPIDTDAKFVAYAIMELNDDERNYIKNNPLVFDPIKTKLKKLGYAMNHDQFVAAYTHLLDVMDSSILE